MQDGQNIIYSIPRKTLPLSVSCGEGMSYRSLR